MNNVNTSSSILIDRGDERKKLQTTSPIIRPVFIFFVLFLGISMLTLWYLIKDVVVNDRETAEALLYVCAEGHVANEDGTCTASLSDPAEDGIVLWGGIGYGRINDGDTISFGKPDTGVIMWKGYIEWDISSIPDTATIQSVDFLYHGAENTEGDSEMVVLDDELEVGVSPLTRTDTDLFHIVDLSPEVHGPWNPTVSEGQTISLIDRGISTLQSHLSYDWFGIGFNNPGTYDTYDTIYSEEYASANPAPTLVVTYGALSELYQITNLDSNLDAVNTIEQNVELGTDNGVVGQETIRILKAADFQPIAEANDVNFTQDLIWDNISADYDLQKSFINITGSLEGVTGTYTLFVPREIEDDRVRVCPDASNLSEVSSTCTNGFVMGDGETNSGITATKTTVDEILLWRLEGITGTGALSYQYVEEDNEDGNEDGNDGGDEDGEEGDSNDEDNSDDDSSDDDGLPDEWEDEYNCVDSSADDANEDPDNDFLSNYNEYLNNTNPCDADSDDGGVMDGPEVNRGTDPNWPVDDYWYDTDKDGLSDGTEDYMCTDKYDFDTDDDGYGDGEEVNKGTDPCNADDPDEETDFEALPDTGSQDSDNDGLTDAEEKQIGTDPNKADTDDDGLSDGEEVNNYKTNPLLSDTDGDSLSDYTEVFSSYGEDRSTDPNNKNTDGDCKDDGAEDENKDGSLDAGETDPTLDDGPCADSNELWERIRDMIKPIYLLVGGAIFLGVSLLLILLMLIRKKKKEEKKGTKMSPVKDEPSQ